MRLTRTEHRAAATLAFRATRATDAAARAPDVTLAQGGWEEEPGEEGGTTGKKEATLPPPAAALGAFPALLRFGAACWTRIRPPRIVLCQEQICPVAIAAARARPAAEAALRLTTLSFRSTSFARPSSALRCLRTYFRWATTPFASSWSSGGFPLPQPIAYPWHDTSEPRAPGFASAQP